MINMIRTMVVAITLFASIISFANEWSGKTGIVTLTETAEVNDDDLDVVTNLTGIVLDGQTTDLIFMNERHVATMNGTITGDGRIIKRGMADVLFGKPHTTATFTNVERSGWNGCYKDYYTEGGIVVETGDLWFPQDGAAPCAYGPLTVNNNATLHILPDKMTGILSLQGSGKVSNGRAWTCWDVTNQQLSLLIGYYGSADVSDFRGTFEGNFSVTMCGNVRIRCVDTDRAAMSCAVYKNASSRREIGTLRIGKFGLRPPYSCKGKGPDDTDLSSYASPLGIGSSYSDGVDYDINYGGALIYEGIGETTDRRFRFGGSGNPEYSTLDAGANGGVNFSGEFKTYGSDKYYGAVLCGSNAVEMTVSGTVEGGDGRIHYIKSGSGTWNWSPKKQVGLAGAFFVVDGTLKFPTLANIGDDCALGLATNCWKSIKYAQLPAYWSDLSNRLDCEMVLGDWNGGGGNFPTLAYTGASVSTSNRRIGLIGAGGTIRNTDSSGSLKLTGGVSPRKLCEVSSSTDVTVTQKTLCLDAAGVENVIGPISENAAGTISLLKKGTGMWTVKGDFSIHGDIDVQEGVLSFGQKGLAPYTWYRYTITQVNKANDSAPDQSFWQRQLGLFDKDGNRLATGLAFVGPSEDVYKTWHGYAGNYDCTALLPGQVTMGEYVISGGIIINNANSTPSCLFADSTSYLRAVAYSACQLASDSSKFPIVFRLPEGSATPKYYDIVQHYDCSSGAHIGAFKLEGSVNGKEWDLLSEVTECQHRTSTQWFSTGVEVLAGQGQNCREPGSEFGYEISSGMENGESLDFSNANAIKVAKGATLQVTTQGVITLPKLTIDCGGTGLATVRGFKIAEAGVLTLANAPKGAVKLPVSFVECVGLKNLEGWTATVEGKTRNRYKITVSGDDVILNPFGMVIQIR